MRFPTPVLVLALLALAPAGVRAEDPPGPAERFREVAAKLPAPTGERGFRVDGVLRAGELEIGTFRLSARPALRDGAVVWEVEDTAHLRVGERVLDATTRAWLDASLDIRGGHAERTEDGRTTSVSFRRDGEEIRVRRREAGGAERTEEIPAEGDLLATLSALVLFARLAPEEAAEYEARGFDPLPPEGRHVDGLRLSAKGLGEFGGRPARIFVRADERRTLTIALAPRTAEPLGLRLEEKGGLTVDYVPAPPGVDPARERAFEPPADTPEKAALILALAWGTGDGALLDRMADWTSVHREYLRKHPDAKVDREELRREVTAGLAKVEAKRAREDVLSFLRMASTRLTVVRPGPDRATVTFPPSLGRLSFVLVRGRDAAWRLAELP